MFFIRAGAKEIGVWFVYSKPWQSETESSRCEVENLFGAIFTGILFFVGAFAGSIIRESSF